MTTTPQMVSEWLWANSYTGLVCTEVPCGCGLDDLHPCGEDISLCEAAYAVLCDGSNCEEGCEAKPYPVPEGWTTVCFVHPRMLGGDEFSPVGETEGGEE